jgi:D-arabinose 1-dehydrogenase-like Zn-dependent alcohol dehydrogenase
VLDATRPQGVIVPVGFMAGTEVSFDIRNFFFGQKQIRGALAGDIEDLRWALQKVKEGKLHPTLDRALPLEEAAEAHRLIAANQVTGSIALLPWAA